MMGTHVAAAEILLDTLPDRNYVPDERAASVWLRATRAAADGRSVTVTVDDSNTAISAYDEQRVLRYSVIMCSETPDTVVIDALNAVERDALGIGG